MTHEAKAILRAAAEAEDMPESAVLSRLLRWYTAQNEVIRREILGQLPRSVRAKVARAILRDMAKK